MKARTKRDFVWTNEKFKFSWWKIQSSGNHRNARSFCTLREEKLGVILGDAMKNATIMKQMEFVVEQDANSHGKHNILQYARRQLVIWVTYKRAKQQFPYFLFFNFLRGDFLFSTQMELQELSPSEA